MRAAFTRSFFSLVVLSLAAGCDCGTPPAQTAQIVVQVDPPTVSLGAGRSQKFSALVTGTNNTEVTWSVDETNAGTITADGVFTAGTALGTVHVRATSVLEPTASGTAIVTVLPSTNVAVSLVPANVTLQTSATQQFVAAVAGTENTTVLYSVQEGAAGGSITTGGLYTAPSSPGVFHVVAVSEADKNVKAVATVTVTQAPAVVVSVNPSTISLGAQQTQQFTATVTGVSDTSVTWTVLETNGGSVTAGGFYTAPTLPGVYHLEAKSRAVPAKTAIATITVDPILVAVTPAQVLVEIGSTQQFTATVTGAASTAVTWSIQEGVVCGAINASGLYTPPSTVGTCHVIATTVIGGVTASATVNVINPVTVLISPLNVTLSMNQLQQFSATVQGSTNQAVTWSVKEGGIGGTITAAGLYTAPTVAAQGVFHVVATPQANPAKAAEATVTVNPGIGVQVTPQLVTLTPGAAQDFVASVTGTSNLSVTWAVQEGAAGGTINAAGHYVAPANASGTFHVVATAVADTSKKGFATVVVLGNPVDVTGIVTYSGSKTGTVYVILADDDGSAGIVGTSTTLVNGQAPFTLRGITARGDFRVRAFIDTMGSGMYHQAVDPFGSVSVTVGNAGLTGVVVPAANSQWNQWLSLATPTLNRVVAGDESVIITYTPAWDFNGNDECKDYRLYWSDTPNVSGSNNIGSMLLVANAPRMAVVRGLTNGQALYFTMTCPDALLLGGYAPEIGPVTVGTTAGGFSLSGAVNSPALPGSIVPPLYVLALSQTGTGGTFTRVSAPAGSQAYTLTGLAAGTYSLYAFRDIGGDGKLTPTDPGNFFTPATVVVSANQNAPALEVRADNAIATVTTGHLNEMGSHSYSLFFRVRANLKRPVLARLASGPKVAMPYDLPLNETGGARHEVRLPLAGIVPAAGDAYAIAVTYSDGTSETLTASVSALLPTPEIVTPALLANQTPTFQWNPLSPAPATSYTYSLRLYDWPYLALGTMAPLLGWADNVSSSTTLLLYSDVHPTQSQLSSAILPYWLLLSATDDQGNWSRTVSSFFVQ
jgi:hypothetical protein